MHRFGVTTIIIILDDARFGERVATIVGPVVNVDKMRCGFVIGSREIRSGGRSRYRRTGHAPPAAARSGSGGQACAVPPEHSRNNRVLASAP
jgi:hypothetical protein